MNEISKISKDETRTSCPEVNIIIRNNRAVRKFEFNGVTVKLDRVNKNMIRITVINELEQSFSYDCYLPAGVTYQYAFEDAKQYIIAHYEFAVFIADNMFNKALDNYIASVRWEE
jgi:hypothetical protein